MSETPERWVCSRCRLPDPEATIPALISALEAVRDWYGLDGDGISDPVRQQVLAALALVPPVSQ